MGGTLGHVALGLAFLLIGLWHLFNSIKLHSLGPNSYSTLPWFPVSNPRLRLSEPITIMLVTAFFISSELFLSSKTTLPHLEHSIIALSFFVYALFALLLDKLTPGGPGSTHGLAHFLLSVTFGQQLLILHLHSTDHAGVEGQYHWLLQLITSASMITTLVAVGCPRSFVNSFVRALSVVFQGVWLVVSGVMLWTPRLVPEGCYLKPEFGRVAVLCRGDRALSRAKAMVNVQFGIYLVGLTVFSMTVYLVVVKCYARPEGVVVEYTALTKVEDVEGRTPAPVSS